MGPCRSCWNGTSALHPEEITLTCVLSIKVPIRKISGKLFNDPRIRFHFLYSSLLLGFSYCLNFYMVCNC